MEGQIFGLTKRRVIVIATKNKTYAYDRGWWWDITNIPVTPHRLEQYMKLHPASNYDEILTFVENGKFITLINYEDFNSYAAVEGPTDMEDGIYKNLPDFKYVEKTIAGEKIMTPQVEDVIHDIYNRIYGAWRVESHLGDDEDTIEIIYNNYQGVSYYIIYKKDMAIILSPITSFILNTPLAPKFIDVVKSITIREYGYYGFALWPTTKILVHKILNNEEEEDEFTEVFGRGGISVEPLSNSSKLPVSQITVPFIDGEKPIFASAYGFHTENPKDFRPEKATRKLENIIKPTYYSSSDGDFEMKLFEDLNYAVRYKEYIVLPCGLIRLNDEISLEDFETAEKVAEKSANIGYKYATANPRDYIREMKFVPPKPHYF